VTLDLARALASADTLATIAAATIVDLSADGTVTVDLGGGRTVPGCRVLATYSPVTGDAVEVSDSVGLAWTISPAYSDAASSGTKTVSATNTQSYRSSDKWERDEVYQGAYSGSTSLGYFRGCYFYGNAFGSLSGKTCTRLRIRISRKGAGGIAGAEGVYLAPHAHASRPSGSPIWRGAARKVGSLAWGDSDTFDLPTSWGQGLIDGTVKGFGHLRDSSSDYAIFNSLAADAASGRLTLDWTD
jgi:hypothetical protein